MTVVLTFLLSGILALAGLHSGSIRGTRQWASANLLISLGFGLAFTPMVRSPWMFVFSNLLVTTGMCLQIYGIQVFEEKRPDRRLLVALACLSLIQNIWFSVLSPDVTLRIIANSLLYGFTSAICARALLIRIDPPLRTAYWFTGAAFMLLVVVMLARIGAVLMFSPAPNYLLSPLPINLIVFFLISLTMLCTTFGFVLMLNYRLATDLQSLAARDSLTNALNRRSLVEAANKLQAIYSRSGDHLAVIMIDVDDFKTVNDHYGHLVGDDVLKMLSATAHHVIRTTDYFARYGGEEFCILLPGTTEKEASVLADRLRLVFAETPIDCGKNELLRCTISLGITDSFQSGLSFSELIADADRALYHAKQTGRNRIVAASSLVVAKVPNSANDMSPAADFGLYV